MYSEDDLLPLSALQHLVFCERQCALIHLEGAWAENRLTAEGRLLHERTDEPETEVRVDLRIARALRLRSLRLGLVGQADVVEFHKIEENTTGAKRRREIVPSPRLAVSMRNPELETQEFREILPSLCLCDSVVNSNYGVALPHVEGLWVPYPVEYKRGKPKPDRCDEVQLCGQAMCLEEMLGVSIPAGALFYGQPRRRQEVDLDPSLRAETEALAERLHDLLDSRRTPPASYEKKCESCSLLEQCRPKAIGSSRSARTWLDRAIEDAEK